MKHFKFFRGYIDQTTITLNVRLNNVIYSIPFSISGYTETQLNRTLDVSASGMTTTDIVLPQIFNTFTY